MSVQKKHKCTYKREEDDEEDYEDDDDEDEERRRRMKRKRRGHHLSVADNEIAVAIELAAERPAPCVRPLDDRLIWEDLHDLAMGSKGKQIPGSVKRHCF